MISSGTITLDMKNPRIAKFVNYLMLDGKKLLATRLLMETFAAIEAKGRNPLETFTKAIENIMPRIEVRPKRVGGSIYQVPQEVPAGRQVALAARWILNSARSRSGGRFAIFLAAELIDASDETGNAFKKKLEVYKMAEANKAFARYATPSSR